MNVSPTKLIRIHPPLPVKTASATGLLHELNADLLIVQWATGEFYSGSLEISLSPDHSVFLDAQATERGLVPSDNAAKAHVLDLLHRLRKEQHIRICAEEDVEASDRFHGFSNVTLPHIALPEIAWSDLDTSRSFMGRSFRAPILITGMTGGVDQAATINERLATAAVRFGIPMGVGSQRIALENPKHAGIFQLKQKFPELFLLGNIGIGQLLRDDYLGLCKQAVNMIEADALAIHVNVLQELVQVEGDRSFKGVIERIGKVVQHTPVPVLVKEVGAGLDPRSIRKLYDVGVRYFDVGGRGGTSWSMIEGRRSDDPLIQRLGKTFRDWGIPTAHALAQAKSLELAGVEFVATGGLRDGVTILKAIHSGATLGGVGLPFFRAALKDADAVCQELDHMLYELKIAMMCSGIKTLP